MPFTAFIRSLWDARAAKYAYNLPVYPVTHVYIHHGASMAPVDLRDADGDGIPDNEESIWRSYQRYHMDTRGWSDIAYNFGVGKSGAVLEGRGWRRQGGATGSPDDRYSLSICAIGNFERENVTPEMMDSIVAWIIYGIEQGHIVQNPVIRGHRDKPYGTSCPGRHLYHQLPQVRSQVADGRVSRGDDDMLSEPLSNWDDVIRATPDGGTNEAIRLWQFQLWAWDFLPFEEIDGVKGPVTRAANKRFEEEVVKNDNPNGVPGSPAWAMLLAGPPDPAPVEVPVEVEVEVEVIPDRIRNLVEANGQLANTLQDAVDEVDG